jgi:hypothetical protein
LVGDFDEHSALELLMALSAYGHHVKKVFIHTSDLCQVDPAGRELFRSTFVDFNAGRNSVIRTGDQDIGLS